MTNGDNLSIGLVLSSDRMTKKRSEAEDTSFGSFEWSVSTSENDRFGIFVDDEFSIEEEAMLGVLKFGILVLIDEVQYMKSVHRWSFSLQ